MKINNITIKEPKSLRFVLSDVDGDTYRDARGNIHRDRLATKRKLEIEWAAMSTSELSTLLNAVKDTFFTVYYLDGLSGTWKTGTFYVGDRTAPMYSLHEGLPVWEGLSMNFIEK